MVNGGREGTRKRSKGGAFGAIGPLGEMNQSLLPLSTHEKQSKKKRALEHAIRLGS